MAGQPSPSMKVKVEYLDTAKERATLRYDITTPDPQEH